ncbi:MAG: hypothetical protein GY820_26205 [Gammaproteobacteria bacterium]|nr:hypothetical protein [Gammaproteobacteria bacterium]
MGFGAAGWAMKYLSTHPGAVGFRFVLMIIIITALMGLFFVYNARLENVVEQASIQQTKNIIQSSLAVAFASYAVEGTLDKLNGLNRGNPFRHLEVLNMVPNNYVGEIEGEGSGLINAGWYFDLESGETLYKTYSDKKVLRFIQLLDYRDVNNSGEYESGVDEYIRLYFKQLAQQ